MGQEIRGALWRAAAVAEFVSCARHGDAATFTRIFPTLDWPGAWRETFARLVAAGAVHPSIPPVFIENWRRMKAQAATLDWHLERDFDDHLCLMIGGLRRLMPPLGSRPAPLALFRGQRLEDYRAGRIGCWWTLDPTYAEIYARTPSRRCNETGAVIMTFDPHAAVVGVFDGEFVLDPRVLDDVHLVAALPPHLDGEGDDPERAYTMAGIPDGLDGDRLLEWLDLGMPVEGLPAVRVRRGARIKTVMADPKPIPA